MKRVIASILSLALLLALALPALADADIMYVNRDTLKVYKEKSKDSKVLKTLKGGQKLLIETRSGSWYGILVEDTKHGGQMMGWVQGKYLSYTMPPEYCSHKWSKWEVYREATCTRSGLRTRYCKICGLSMSDEIPKTGHSFGPWRIRKEATCIRKGERVRVCKICGYEEKEQYYADHEFGSWKTTKEPTCTARGERVRYCKICGYEDEEPLDKLPHDYEWQVTVEPTDHSAGTRARICVNCGHNGGQESFDPEGTLRRGDRGESVRAMQQALVEQGYLNAGGADGIFGGGTEKAVMQFQRDQGLVSDGVAWPQTLSRLQHDFGPWQVVKPLTRSEPGERVRVCKDCGYVQRETIEPGNIIVRNSRGEPVRELQQILRQLGYDVGSLDGVYGGKLDAAFRSFAEAKGLLFTPGKIRPADVDALVNAWLDRLSMDRWKGEGSVNTPVNLALTVTAMADETEDPAQTTYIWTLTNLGSEKCRFNALLLTYGDHPDFRKDNLVMKIDDVELKPNCGNSVFDSFTVSGDWGEGNLNFAAMATVERNGDIWLSNTVVFEGDVEGEPKTVEPLPVDINVNALPDGVYPVAFDRGDVANLASGVYMNAVHVYSMDTYAAADVEGLAAGDTIVIGGEPCA